ncbi:MAG: tetratricopeptide repeat protein [Betaproteobacteria bacterium]|nr:tetratricopeptide repeat protein [Betaproteobacteria bacterium]
MPGASPTKPVTPGIRAALAGVCVLTVLAYLPGIAGPFQFDDYVTVATDPGARSLAAWWENLGTHVRPLLKASFVLTGALGHVVGDLPTGHRIGNLAIHLAATLAFFLFGSRVSEMLEPWREPSSRSAHAWLAAAVFALHPLSTEAVSYLSARSASLATLASVLALLCWFDAREARGARRVACAIGGLAAWAIACGSREVAAAMPLVFLLVEWLRVRPDADPRARRRLLIGLASLVAVGCVAFLAWMASHPRYGPLLELSARILAARLHEPAMATALGYLGCVAALVCAPNIDPTPVAASWPQAFILAAGLLLAATLALRARRRRPMALVALAWAALWLLPVYVLPIRHDLVAERHAYAAVWSLGWLVGAILVPLVSSAARSERIAGQALTVLLLGVLALLSADRNREYRSEVTLWEAAERDSPPKLRVLNNLGAACIEAGCWEQAERALRAASRLDPDNEIVEINLDRALRRSPN